MRPTKGLVHSRCLINEDPTPASSTAHPSTWKWPPWALPPPLQAKDWGWREAVTVPAVSDVTEAGEAGHSWEAVCGTWVLSLPPGVIVVVWMPRQTQMKFSDNTGELMKFQACGVLSPEPRNSLHYQGPSGLGGLMTRATQTWIPGPGFSSSPHPPGVEGRGSHHPSCWPGCPQLEGVASYCR